MRSFAVDQVVLGTVFEEDDTSIRLAIERQLANRMWGSRAKILTHLKGDGQFEEAVRILQDSRLYREKMNLTLAAGD